MIFFLIASAVLVHAIHGHHNRTVDVPTLVKQINSKATTWTAHTYGLKKVNLDKVRRNMLGLISINGNRNMYHSESNFPASTEPIGSDELPESFNWTTDSKNYGCPIGHIRDQSNCGSCWAVSTAAAFGDRLCLASKGKFKTPLSARHLLSCDKKSWGCEGGQMESAHSFLVEHGLTTGGDYDSDIGCQPYPVWPCGYGQDPSTFFCLLSGAKTPKCMANDKCTNDEYPYARAEKLFKASGWYNVKMDEYAIRKNIYEKGPVTAGYVVYVDFEFYKKGIYVPTWKFPIGSHAVRIVGWGVENEIKYWLVANSWGTKWGEDGFFRIIRGVNAAHFEEMITAADPIVD